MSHRREELLERRERLSELAAVVETCRALDPGAAFAFDDTDPVEVDAELAADGLTAEEAGFVVRAAMVNNEAALEGLVELGDADDRELNEGQGEEEEPELEEADDA